MNYSGYGTPGSSASSNPNSAENYSAPTSVNSWSRNEEIEVIISQEGDVQLVVRGVKGEECIKLTEEIQEALGIVVSQEKTSEFYQKNFNTNITQIQNENKTSSW
mmetsp:Transcript_10173/g.18317  ORF Transcript_10173/g.18317 Transcript_10173/m.18317 type:complete len:105 (+) Transcript_10173:366-680(+)